MAGACGSLSALLAIFRTGRENMSKPVAKDLDEQAALREVIDALRADMTKPRRDLDCVHIYQ